MLHIKWYIAFKISPCAFIMFIIRVSMLVSSKNDIYRKKWWRIVMLGLARNLFPFCPCASFHDMTSFLFAGFCPRIGCEKCTTRCSPAYRALKHCKYLIGQTYHLALIKRYRAVNDYSHNSLCVGISMVIPLHALCRDRSTECRTYVLCKFVTNQRIKLQ